MALQTDEDVKRELDTLREFLKRQQRITSEIEVLRLDLKELNEEFKDKLDLKTLRLAVAVAKAKGKVAHKFTFDNILEVLEDEGWMEKGQ